VSIAISLAHKPQFLIAGPSSHTAKSSGKYGLIIFFTSFITPGCYKYTYCATEEASKPPYWSWPPISLSCEAISPTVNIWSAILFELYRTHQA